MRMRKLRISWVRVVVLGALFLVPLTPSVTAEVYSWTTEDGTRAWTDDRDSVPPRYADQVRVLGEKDSGLQGYERLTRPDPAASDRYADRLAQRLEHLRRVNDQPTAAATARRAAPSATTLSLSTGGVNSPRIDLSTSGAPGEEPLIVEPVLTKRHGAVRTRRSTVVRQGDKTVAIIKGRRHHTNPNDDIYDEEDLDEGRF